MLRHFDALKKYTAEGKLTPEMNERIPKDGDR